MEVSSMKAFYQNGLLRLVPESPEQKDLLDSLYIQLNGIPISIIDPLDASRGVDDALTLVRKSKIGLWVRPILFQKAHDFNQYVRLFVYLNHHTLQ